MEFGFYWMNHPFPWPFLPHHVEHADKVKQLECGPMPNVMAAQSNRGGTICWTLLIKSWKSRSGAIWGRKNGTSFSETTKPMYRKPVSSG